MKMTVTQWTQVQDVLERELGDMTSSGWTSSIIETRTWGKRWRDTVGISLDQDGTSLVYDALDIISYKAENDDEVAWVIALLDAAPKWRTSARAIDRVPAKWDIDLRYEGDGSSTLDMGECDGLGDPDPYRALVGTGHISEHGEGFGQTRDEAIRNAHIDALVKTYERKRKAAADAKS